MSRVCELPEWSRALARMPDELRAVFRPDG